MPAWLYGHGGFLERSVCETFIAVCVAFAAWCAVRIVQGTGGTLAALMLGLAAGAAVVLKPNAGLYYPAILVWIASSGVRRRFVPIVGVSLAGAVVVPALALLWLWRLDVLHEARVAVIEFNRYYVGQGFALDSYALDFARAVWLRIKTDPLWLAGTVASIVAVAELVRRRRLAPLPGLAMALGAASAVVIVVNGARLFNSYFINPLLPLSLMAAWMLGEIPPRARTRQVLVAATAAAMAFLLVTRGYPDRVFGWVKADLDALRGREAPGQYLERFGGYANGRGYSARANAELAEYIERHTTPSDRVFLFGISGAGVYFGSGRLTAHRFLRVNFFIETDFLDPRFRLEPVLAELATVQPRYIIFERLHGRSAMAQTADALPAEPAVQALLGDYSLETQIEDYTLFRRIDRAQ
jgi:hypothetical protein